MAKKYLYGFDIGTSESKGTICDQDGNVIATAASAHSLKTPHPGWAEHDPIGDWWYDFKKITAELLQKSVCSRKVFSAPEAFVCTQRTRMRSF